MTRTPQTLAVKLNTAGERSVHSGHPWIFSNSINKLNKEGHTGDICVIFSSKTNKVIGVGLYDPDSPIRIKMLHHGGPVKIDTDFYTEKISAAFDLRRELLKTQTNAYRLIFGENDQLPGLIADVYNKVLVIKLYSAIWFPFLEVVQKILLDISSCDTTVLRLNRRLQQRSSTGFSDGQILFGELENEEIEFLEHGVKFRANVIKGHKTGYFLDHRHNRKRVGELSHGKTVLDVFCYAGGFSVHALAKGARSVTSIDVSKQALELCVSNAAINEVVGEHITQAGDAFELLEEHILQKKKYDVVVIDPPSFAKSKDEISMALKKYRQLAEMGIKLTDRKGLLLLASCSSRVSKEDYVALVNNVLEKSGRVFKLIDINQHDSDHPIGFPEGAYLKTVYIRMD